MIADGRRNYARYRVICGDCNRTHYLRLQVAEALLATCPECEGTCILVEEDKPEV